MEQVDKVDTMELRRLLLGAPLCDRDGPADDTVEALQSHVGGLAELIKNVYGPSMAAKQAVAEINSIAALKMESNETVCKRAALLFALSKELEVQSHFSKQERATLSSEGPHADEPTFSEDMARRVLPLLVPCFLRHSCQSPDCFVLSCVVLAEMWKGEQLGNWPLSSSGLGCD